jgi:hypothetical protein
MSRINLLQSPGWRISGFLNIHCEVGGSVRLMMIPAATSLAKGGRRYGIFASHRQDMKFQIMPRTRRRFRHFQRAAPAPLHKARREALAGVEPVKSSEVLNYASRVFLLPFS